MDKLRLKISTSMSGTGCKLPGLLAFAVSALFGFSVIANPTGGSVTAGQASISSSGSTLTINQSSDKAIIDWRGFDINAGETTRFSQPGSSSITLNRVNALTPSQINGTLTANGNLVIINPNGVIFGRNSQVNANSLIATSSDIDNGSFMQNSKLVFNKPGSSAAQIVNQGSITVYDAGLVGLVAPHVENSGVINARLGRVTLASGDEFTLDLAGDGLTQIALSAPIQQFAGNSGIIQADGGLIQITAAAARSGIDSLISNTGILEARSVGEKNGVITLYAEGSNAVAGNDTTQKGLVSGSSTVENSGIVDASGYGSGQTGGTIQILGDHVSLLSGSHIDVSGDTGGGTVRIGGDFHGQGITPTALQTTMASDATIKADAVTSGNGGNVAVWSDGWTNFAGFISARGGALSGNGGFVETSGKNILQATGLVDAGASFGSAGHWLLDPNNITIANSGSDNNISCISGTCTTTDNNAFVTTSTINAALNSGTDITIQTGTNGSNSEDGYILVNSGSTISKTSGGDATLTLASHQGIFFDGNSGSPISIGSTSGKLNLVLHTDTDQTGNGIIWMNYTNINTNNGNITFGGGANPFTSPAPGMSGYTDGISMIGDSLSAGSGNILLNGHGYDDASTGSHFGILLASGTTLNTTSGNITLNGTAGTSSDSSWGIVMHDSGTSITSNSGLISLTGTGGTVTSGSSIGFLTYSGAAITNTSGGITISGTAGAGSSGGSIIGDWISDTAITSQNGNISISGTGAAGTGTYNNGVLLDAGTLIKSTGTATISLNGTGGDGTSQNYGVRLDDGHITSATGNITLTGQGGNGSGDQNKGVDIENGSTISSTGTATITLSGTGGNGASENDGVYINGSTVSSLNGNMSLIGQGGSGSGDYNRGVVLSSATINSTGNATIDFNGTGGTGGYYGYGVEVYGSSVSSQTGNIHILGQGGTASFADYGIGIENNSLITSTGSANILLEGINGSGSGGVGITDNTGYNTLGGNSMTGNLTISTDSMDFSTLAIRSGGIITMKPYTASTSIGIHGGSGTLSDLDSNFLALIDTSTVSPSSVVIGNSSAGSGAVTIGNNWNISGYTFPISVYGGSIASQGITLGGHDLLLDALVSDISEAAGAVISKSTGGDITLTLASAGSIFFNGISGNQDSITSTSGKLNVIFDADSLLSASGGITYLGYTTINSNGGNVTLGGGSNPFTTASYGNFTYNYGIALEATSINAGAGNILLRGTGWSSAGSSSYSGLKGIRLLTGSSLSTSSGNISLIGTGGAGTGDNIGIDLEDSSSIASSGGHISLTGTGGGTANFSMGIKLFNYSGIDATGNASVTVSGTGGGNDNGYGVILSSNAFIHAVNGDISVTGQGAVSSWGQYNDGVVIGTGGDTSNIATSGTGSITVNGIGGGVGAGGHNYGTILESGSIVGAGGDVIVTGQGGAGTDSDYGLLLYGSSSILNTGNISLTAIAGGGTNNYALWSSNGSNILGGNAMTGDLTLIGDSINFHNLSIITAGHILLKPYTASTSIGINGGSGALGDVDSGFLSFIDTSTVSPSNVIIGNSSSGSGAVNIGSGWNISSYNFPISVYGGSITTGSITGGSHNLLLDALSGDITLNSGAALTSTSTGTGLTLIASGNFINNSNASALSDTNGRWLVYSTNPANDTLNSLASDFRRFSCTYGGTCPSFASTGNGFLYTITPTLTVTPGTLNVTYGSGANLSGYGYTLSGYLGSDASSDNVTGTLTGTTSYVAGNNVGSYNINYSSGTLASALGYAFSYANSSTALSVLAKTLTASLTGSVSKTYNGNTTATLSSGNYSLTGIYGSDVVNLNNPASGTYDTKDVGTGKTVSVTGLSLSGAAASNYTLASTSVSGSVGQITAKSLTASLTGSVTKTYDRTTAATLASGNYALAGVVGGDTVNLNNPASGTYDTKDVGTGKTVSVTGLSISGTDAGNYTLSSTSASGAVGQIDAKSLTASLIGSVVKTYDGTTAATLASGNYSLAGIIGGDTVNLNNPASGSYDTKNVGTGKTITVTGLSISGTDAGNYTLSSTSTSGTVGQINAKSLTTSLTGSVTKTYDGTTTATLASGNYSLAGVVGGDTVNLNNPASGTYDTKNVGTGKTVSVTGLSISGTDAGNYTLSSTSTSGAVGQIDAKSLTASLTGSVTKTYDGTTAATLASGNYSLTGIVGGDTVNLNNPASGTYDTKNAGTGKTVSVTGLSISGADVGNYTLSSTSTSGTVGQINAKSLTASLTGSVSKTYDGTTAATLASGNYSLAGIIGGDTVNLNNPASGTYDTKNVGTGKTVTVTGLSISGTDAGNYTLSSTSTSGAVGQINAKSLTASLTGSVTKTYDSTTAATLASGNYSLSGVVGGDTVNLNNPTSGTYDTKNAGTGKTVSVTGLSISGTDAGNYTLSSTSTSGAVGQINAKSLSASLTGSVTKTYDGTTAATLGSGNYSLTGIIGGDTVNLNNPASGTYDTKDVGTGKTVSVTGLSLSGAAAGNYTLASSSISGTIGQITAKSLTAYLTGNVTKTYDGTTTATLASGNYSLSGVVGGDTVSLNNPANGAYDTPDVGTGKVVSVAGLSISGAAAGNYILASNTISGAVGVITDQAQQQPQPQQPTISNTQIPQLSLPLSIPSSFSSQTIPVQPQPSGLGNTESSGSTQTSDSSNGKINNCATGVYMDCNKE
ncbi:MAG TPA: YDG domain-containing protein [Rickettsiales bacterium]|nr:YDG domain-containing protein [Rickettsiales bacterium]